MPLAKNLFSRATKMAHTEATAFLAQEKVLVYHYRGFNNGGTPIVKGGVGVMLRSELEEILRTSQSRLSPMPLAWKLSALCELFCQAAW